MLFLNEPKHILRNTLRPQHIQTLTDKVERDTIPTLPNQIRLSVSPLSEKKSSGPSSAMKQRLFLTHRHRAERQKRGWWSRMNLSVGPKDSRKNGLERDLCTSFDGFLHPGVSFALSRKCQGSEM